MRVATGLLAAVTVLAAGAALAQPRVREIPTAVTGDYELELEQGGRMRTALVHVPKSATEGMPMPVLLNFHGGGGNARAHRDYVQMDGLADRAGFIVVYPNGTGPAAGERLLTWNAGLCCGYAMSEKVDDVGFVRALLETLAKRAPVDSTRVYATGLSNGAMMSYRLAVQLSDRIAAIAPVAGSMVLPTAGNDRTLPLTMLGKRAVPIMHIHSVDDKRAVYYGGLGEPFPFTNIRTRHPNAEEVLYLWVDFEGCAAKPVIAEERRGAAGTPTASHTATKYVFTNCRDGGEIALWKLTGAGHVWPGARLDYLERFLGPGTDVIDANVEMWRFFKRFDLPSR